MLRSSFSGLHPDSIAASSTVASPLGSDPSAIAFLPSATASGTAIIAQTNPPPSPPPTSSPIWLWLFLIVIPAGWIALAVWRWRKTKEQEERDRTRPDAPPSGAEVASNRAESIVAADRAHLKGEEPAIEEPTEEPVVKPVAEPVVEPIAEEPMAEPIEEPVIEEPVNEEPAIEEPAIEEPTQEPVAEEPGVEPIAEEPVEEPVEEPGVVTADIPVVAPPVVAQTEALPVPSAPSPEPTLWPDTAGDRDQTEIEAARFSGPPSTPEDLADVDASLPGLPDGYGDGRIMLLPRDPQWAYAYWDLTNDQKMVGRNQGGERLALRLYDVTDIVMGEQNPHSVQQYDCDELARDWYLPIPVSDRNYAVEIGYLTHDGRWLPLARSPQVRIPPVYPSDWFSEQFLTVTWDEDLRGKTLIQLTPPEGRSPKVSIHQQLYNLASAGDQRTSGSLFGSMQGASEQNFSGQNVSGQTFPEQHLSSHIFSAVFPSGMGAWALPTASGMGAWALPSPSGMGLSGAGQMDLGLAGAYGLSSWMSAEWASGVGFSASAPPERSRKFWLVADAELIVYGATEPDAKVTIAGHGISLAPDGTFRLQVSFPDGVLEYPIQAIAADGEQQRSIRMIFRRDTPHRNTNTPDEASDEWF